MELQSLFFASGAFSHSKPLWLDQTRPRGPAPGMGPPTVTSFTSGSSSVCHLNHESYITYFPIPFY